MFDNRKSILSKSRRRPSYKVNGMLTEEQIKKIEEHFKQVLDEWLNSSSKIEFFVGDLVGDENKDWHGKPCQIIYDKYLEIYKRKYGDFELAHKKAFSRAAQDAGYFYYNFLFDHDETFIVEYGYRKGKRVRKYIRSKQ